jgi:hypothetical protein
MNKYDWNHIFAVIGKTSVIIVAVWGIAKTLFVDWIKSQWNKRANRQLEDIKGEIARNNSSLNSITGAFLNNYQKVQEKRTEAAQLLWQAVLKIRDGMPNEIALALRVYTDEELKTVASNKNDERNVKIRNVDFIPFQNLIHDTSKDLEKYKPFISDRCYLYFESYASLIGRYSYKILDGFKKGKLILWTEDAMLKNMAIILTTDEQLKIIFQHQMLSFILLLQVAEKNIISELRDSITGKNIPIDAAEYIRSTNEVLKNNNAKNQ